MSAGATIGAVVMLIPGFLIFVLGVGFAGYLNAAYPLMKLWGWFIAPVFGLPPLTFWQAVGLMLTLAVARVGIRPSDSRRPTQDKVMEFVALYLSPWVALILGWIVLVLS